MVASTCCRNMGGEEDGGRQMKVHCLFEQSGTFKNEFKKLGYQAYDYDILNDFNETDNVIDIFNEIETAYTGGGASLTA